MRMIKDVFIDFLDKLLGNEDLVEINTEGFFVCKFDPETQEFKKVLYDPRDGKWKLHDMTDPEQVAKKVVEAL